MSEASTTNSEVTTAARRTAERYDRAVEPKWRERWERDELYKVDDTGSRPKWYSLTMYPYPSGRCTSAIGTRSPFQMSSLDTSA